MKRRRANGGKRNRKWKKEERKWGMRHTSTALYFYGASKKSLQKPQAIFGNMLFKINYGLNYYLQLLC
jgi:hypothetical protein